jgi:transmembrane sensor
MAAAIVFVALGLRVLLELRASAGGTRRQVATGAMGVVTVTLADRSSIRLGPDSRLDVVENARATVAHLQGRAFFGVTANPARPFIVRTEYGDAVVHGTRFEVSTDRGAMRVLVVDGRVSLNAAGVSTPLIRGDVGLHQRGAPTRTYRLVNVDEELDWMGNALIFQRTPFLQAISEIEIRYGVKVQVDQPPASDLTITATFTDQPLDQIVQVVCETVRAKCSVVHS